MGRARLEISEMNANRDVLVILIKALAILLISGGDEALEDSSLRSGGGRTPRLRWRDG